MNPEENIARFRDVYDALRAEIGKVFVGQEAIVAGTLNALFANGHVLLEGVPGLGKTLLVKTLSQVLNLSFSRIQFTPDLMPADITGTEVLTESGRTRKLNFVPGPVFANMVLADEINRTPPKTQAALLEAVGVPVKPQPKPKSSGELPDAKKRGKKSRSDESGSTPLTPAAAAVSKRRALSSSQREA